MEAKIKTADFKRKALKAEMKIVEDELKKQAPNSPNPITVEDQMAIILGLAEQLYQAVEVVIDGYLQDGDETNYLEQTARLQKYKRELTTLRRKVGTYLDTVYPPPPPPRIPDVNASADLRKVSLPQMKLPEFSGNVREWLGFWAAFSVIDNNTGITDAEKFQYLLQCLKPASDARRLISSFPVCDSTYPAAVDMLKKQYGRNSTLVKVYVLDLLQLVVHNANQKNRVDVMDLVPQISSQIRNLSQLGVTSDKCEQILYPVLESCLPENLLQAWQRNSKFEEKIDPLMTFLNEEVANKMDRTLAKMNFGVPATPAAAPFKGKGNKARVPGDDIPAAAAFMAVQGADKGKSKSNKKCAFCDRSHDSHDCGKAKTEMTLEQRQEVVKDKNLCLICLKAGHMAAKCRSFVRCSICTGKHYEMLCTGKRKEVQHQLTPCNMMMTTTPQLQTSIPCFFKVDGKTYFGDPPVVQQQAPAQNPLPPQQQQPSSSGQPNQGTQMSTFTGGTQVAMYTMLVTLEGPSSSYTVRAFVDEGSDSSFILEELAQKLNCQAIGSKLLQHQVFGGKITEPVRRPVIKATLRNPFTGAAMEFNFNSVPAIAQRIRKPQPGDWSEELARQRIPMKQQHDDTEDVHILIGLDIAVQILTGGFHRLNSHFIARETILGWFVGGTQPVPPDSIQVTQTHMVTTMMVENLKPEDMWNLEILGIVDDPQAQSKKDLEDAALQHFERTVKRLPNGRYELELPWIEGHRQIKCNKSQALAQLHRITKDLKEQGHLQNYNKIFGNWLADGIIEEVPQESNVDSGYYMPHKHVIKESSSTTPLRPVFNASAKAKGSVSLNECLEKGPNFLEEIPGLNLRFRLRRVGSSSDTSKAFLQMSVADKHRDFLRFLWWSDKECKEVRVFRHQRVVFGVSPSPFMLAATLKYHIKNEGSSNPVLAKKLLESLYVDNSVTSHSSIEEALEFQEFSQNLLLPAKFDLRGWEYSNSKEEKIVPVLGMDWNTKQDTLQIHLDSVKKKLLGPMTKRGLLSMVNSVFDPMGLACPFTLTSKLLYQECCVRNLGFDDPLPADIAKRLDTWKRQVPELEKLNIPRWAANSDDDSSLSIHTFCDGSKLAFATCVYLRSETEGNVKIQLLYAKSRVAPSKKKLTIPRMELMGCLIGTRLTITVMTALGLEKIPVYFWTDSTTALAWIQNEKPWGRFVFNRVEEIRKNSTRNQWRHVPGELNPADLPSRGCTAEKLVELKWHEGPEWLHEKEEFWPQSTPTPDPEAVMEEMKKAIVSAAVITREADLDFRLERISDFNKILRVVATAQRYIKKLQVRAAARKSGKNLPKPRRSRKKAEQLTVDEIEQAEVAVLKLIQKSAFNGPEDKRLHGMSSFVDKNGLIRIKSQLLFGHDDYNLRCPVVLPDDHTLVKQLIRKEHEINSHAGVQTLQALLRNKFWILRSRRVISNLIRTCVKCRRFLAKKCETPGVPLPFDRIKNTVCFDVTGVDLAGPLFLRGGDRVWIVLFTDAVYRGVHLELTTTLSTEGFIRAFRRFVARRGRPSVVYSDNGLNFVGCSNLFRNLDWDQVQRYAAVERIKWKFNPPTAAWWGGWWERLVGLMKTLLRRILGKQIVHFDELQTIICDVESTLNHRPLTFVSDAAGELMAICPAYHMKDNPHSELPEADAVDAKSLKRSAKKSQELRTELRSRFRKEYLGMLRNCAGGKGTPIKPRDVVLIGSDNSKRIDWPLGIVEEVYVGRDKQSIRSALVKSKDGKFLRDVKRLYMLEMSQEEPEKELPEPKEDLPCGSQDAP